MFAEESLLFGLLILRFLFVTVLRVLPSAKYTAGRL
jgi:hypothetical protein